MATMRKLDRYGLKKVYDSRIEHYDRLKNEIMFILDREIKSVGVPYHALMTRIKSFESFFEKAQRKDIADPMREINDICGIRIICLFLSDLERVRELIMRTLRVVEIEDKIHEVPPQFFGYMGLHLVCELPDHFNGPRYDDLKNLKAEIQVRTISMDAWASISHYLDYKSAVAVPSELKKEFYALSALFYLADSHFEAFVKQQQNAREMATLKAETIESVLHEEVNLDTVMAFLQKKYPSRDHAVASEVSELVDDLVNAGYKTIGEINRDLERTELAFESLESDEITNHAGDGFRDDDVLRSSLLILGGSFARRIEAKAANSWLLNWAREYNYLVK